MDNKGHGKFPIRVPMVYEKVRRLRVRKGWADNLLCLRVGDDGCLIQSLTKPRSFRDVMVISDGTGFVRGGVLVYSGYGSRRYIIRRLYYASRTAG